MFNLRLFCLSSETLLRGLIFRPDKYIFKNDILRMKYSLYVLELDNHVKVIIEHSEFFSNTDRYLFVLVSC